MSFNVRVRTVLDVLNPWATRKHAAVQTIRAFDPDILGTQECLADQTEYLKDQLPDYLFVGVGRNDGSARGEMCGVFVRASRFSKVDSGHFWLSEHPDRPGSKSWGSVWTRMVTWVRLRPIDGGSDLCVFNTHFDVFGSRARLESARLLRRQMTAIAAGLPCIVMGDFNDAPDSAPYQVLLAGEDGSALTDTYRAVRRPAAREGTHHGFSGNTAGKRIDWIVTTGDFQTIDAAIIRDSHGGRYPSDHFPVVAVIRPTAVTAAAPSERRPVMLGNLPGARTDAR